MTPLEKLRLHCRTHSHSTLERLNSARLGDRQVDEFIGLARMALADGILEHHEADFMLRWLEANRHALERWPAKVVYPRLVAALSDDHLSPDEEAELLDLLVHAIGDPSNPELPPASTTLPITDPAPDIAVECSRFCFTGRFYTGTRPRCQQLTVDAGGAVYDRVTAEIDFLVIGDNASSSWLHSTHGRKIEQALAFNEAGKANIRVINERHWAAALGLE